MDNPTNDNYILGLWHLSLQGTEGENERGSELVTAPGVQNANMVDSKTLFHGEKLYLSQVWRDGSTCDLNGLPRTVEVQYFCSPDGSHNIASISEVLTCNYVLVVHVPSLCNVAAFRDIQTEDVNIIKCRLIVPDDPVERDTYLANAHASKKSHYHPAEIDPEFVFATPDQELEQMELHADSTTGKDTLEQQSSDTVNDQLLPLELDAEHLRDILKSMVEESRSGTHTASSATLSMTALSDAPDTKDTPAPSYHDDL
ncbi:Protein OS-9 [Malassezia vespertilionis]|uniref:Protein OS-9 n=1 Tax=Malassezia vespertilionis TaxID=2020962 RepID=UPI0024B0BC48|nr:Protein OS-9 [Malassezia vespertilionis]WFD06727.1 Protein OS-9 [Malassezia vespertilionis]